MSFSISTKSSILIIPLLNGKEKEKAPWSFCLKTFRRRMGRPTEASQELASNAKRDGMGFFVFGSLPGTGGSCAKSPHMTSFGIV
jgi:hypothetical protein